MVKTLGGVRPMQSSPLHALHRPIMWIYMCLDMGSIKIKLKISHLKVLSSEVTFFVLFISGSSLDHHFICTNCNNMSTNPNFPIKYCTPKYKTLLIEVESIGLLKPRFLYNLFIQILERTMIKRYSQNCPCVERRCD